MDKAAFEDLVQSTFDRLPEKFQHVIDNVVVLVEDYPSDDIVRNMNLRSRYNLLGLYQGVPLTARGTFYGSAPTVPDRIFLFQKNIESVSKTEQELHAKIYEVLVHEIAHYVGMTEEEIRAAGF